MRNPEVRLFDDELIIDSFAGGGGASLGIEMALGRSPDIAINHDAEALAMHAVNHPESLHLCEDVLAVDPKKACAGRRVGLMWLSPDCKHHSKAKGGKPVDKKIRGLAWVAVKWAKAVKPRVIALENVEEFEDWGPLLENGRPCPLRKGFTFRRFVKQLENCGYAVEHRELIAADYGSPTTRKRLFLIARCDGLPITWPEPTHAKKPVSGRLPWRTAAECIEWSLPCPSIFERIRPLADNTLRRIARGIKRYVIEAASPFIVPLTHHGDSRTYAMSDPLPTITGAHRGEHALITPFLTEHANASSQRIFSAQEPLRTQCGEVKGGHFSMISPTLIQTGYGERPGQAPRVPGLHKPLGTVVNGQKHALVAAFLAKHYGGVTGQQMTLPIGTVTAVDHHSLAATSLVKMRGTNTGQPVDDPLQTISAQGTHFAEVRAFLVAYYGNDKEGQDLFGPMRTVTAKDRLGLVTVEGEEYAIADIGMRMLQPRELFRAQGFPESYQIDADLNGKPFTKTAQVRMCGNSVCPPVAAAILRAQFMGSGSTGKAAMREGFNFIGIEIDAQYIEIANRRIHSDAPLFADVA